MSQAAKRTPQANAVRLSQQGGFAYTPTLADDAVALSPDAGVFIFREAARPRLIGADPREQDVFWQGFQRLLDNPAPKVRWQARPSLLARLVRLMTGRR